MREKLDKVLTVAIREFEKECDDVSVDTVRLTKCNKLGSRGTYSRVTGARALLVLPEQVGDPKIEKKLPMMS